MVAGSQDTGVRQTLRSGQVSNPGILLGLAATVTVVAVADLWHAEMRAWILQFPAAPVQWLSDHVLRPLKWSITGNFLTPLFFLLVPVIFLLERRWPARPEQPFLSQGLLCDALWVPLRELGKAVFVFWWLDLMAGWMATDGAFLQVGVLHGLPWVAQVVLGLLLVDLLNYTIHRFNHAVPLLWEFHAVHHAQRELNFLTERRIHFVEFTIGLTVYAIPVAVLGLDVVTAGGIALFDMWHSRLSHMNLRTNLGPLRWIFVSPQSHRVHHGRDPRFHNRNFGSMFTFWDQLLGTQEYDWDVYPESGSEDESFPHEQDAQGLRFLAAPVLQAFHPFRRIARGELGGSGPRPPRAA